MDLIQEIRDKISDKTIENLAVFLGEKTQDVESGLLLGIKSFLAGIIKYGHNDANQANILNVLNDGGHSGDIFRNIETFSQNHEKTQLLVTIGNNIAGHFLKDSSVNLIEKISKISEVRKTTASSLLSLSAPLVLGYIGKQVREKNLDQKGLGLWIGQVSDSVSQSLPPVIGNLFAVKKTEPASPLIKSKAAEPNRSEKKPKNAGPGVNWGVVVPWLVLSIAGVYALSYWYTHKKINTPYLNEEVVLKEKKQDLRSEDFLPDSTVSNLPPEVNIVKPSAEIEKPNIQSDNFSKTAEETIKKPEKKEIEVLKQNSGDKSNSKETKVESKVDEIPAGFNSLKNSSFVKNSAEISDNALVAQLANQLLKNASKKITIIPLSGVSSTLAEDRAYSLEGLLIEKGVDPSQITIGKKGKGNTASGIAYKISN